MPKREIKKCCGTCFFARFPLTPTGRRKANTYGECTVEFVEPIVPDCISIETKRHVIWPHFGDDCICYQPLETNAKGTL